MPVKPLKPRPERASNIWHKRRSPLSAMLAPRSIALIGATENAGSVGRTLVENINNPSFRGRFYPVNPKRDTVLGVKAYRSVADLPERVDLAVISTPAPSVPAIITECAKAGIPGAVIISAGFKETGPAGVALEQQILARSSTQSDAHLWPELPWRHAARTRG